MEGPTQQEVEERDRIMAAAVDAIRAGGPQYAKYKVRKLNTMPLYAFRYQSECSTVL